MKCIYNGFTRLVVVVMCMSSISIAQVREGPNLQGVASSIDQELISSAEKEGLNLFLDATDIQDNHAKIHSFKVSNKYEIDITKRMASSVDLAVLEFSPKTLVMWGRPDILSVANRIVKGENIQILSVPQSVLVEVINSSSTRNHDSKKSVGSKSIIKNMTRTNVPKVPETQSLIAGKEEGISTREPILVPALREIEKVTEAKLVGNKYEYVLALSELGVNNQLLLGLYTQLNHFRFSTGASKGAWLTDDYWKNVKVIQQQMPNQVVRRADLNKPRTMIPILSVTGKAEGSTIAFTKSLAVLPANP
jgi:hypothetical protein